ncbi:hypothetical protein QTJ16_007038 [Diplocarpon rosae]|uniref:Zn(2)-C6 fungal-type domain-containing protein n=1 Tax=Diplocarpon rosae TaxID=946125 RepID=A0AAD9SVQ0_9HELO|nr:hypothetical protein QTJ16_007038 [Diplocarpon rosae]
MDLREKSPSFSSRTDSNDTAKTTQLKNTRRPHRKTKTGCLVCKKRKIKCDETHPECDNCIKHSLSCEYAPAKANIIPSSGYIASNGPHDLNMVDLELLHHFSVATAFTLHRDPAIRRIWSITVPQLGFNHDFVMHGILALAALHMGYCRPERKDFCAAHAILHHKSGLAKATPALRAFDEENGSAMYLFSALTCIFAYTTLKDTDDAVLGGESGVAEWIVLSRQSYSLYRMANVKLQAGPLGPLFISGDRRGQRRKEFLLHDNFSGAQGLRELSAYITQRYPDPQIQQAYGDAINGLLAIFNFVNSVPPEMRESSDIFVWPFEVTDGYLDLLQQPTQEALVILAYFAVLPEKIESKWWLEGFGRHLLSKIYLLIDDEHLPWIQWPLQEIGCTTIEQYARSGSSYSTPGEKAS